MMRAPVDWVKRARLLLGQEARDRRLDCRSQTRCTDCRALTGGGCMSIWKRVWSDEVWGHGTQKAAVKLSGPETGKNAGSRRSAVPSKQKTLMY